MLAQLVPHLITKDVLYSMLERKTSYTLDDAKKLHKAQYSSEKYRQLMDIKSPHGGKKFGYSPGRMLEIPRDRAHYVIERGATLNNPHISAAYIARWPEITGDYAAALRRLVGKWFKANQPQARVPLQAQHDRP